MNRLLCTGFIALCAMPSLIGCTDNAPGSTEPVAASESTPTLRGIREQEPAATKKSPEWFDVSDHCSVTYIGSTSEKAFEQVTPAIRGNVLDCIDYYNQHHSYPTTAQLSAFQATQEKAERKSLTPQQRRLRDEYAIGEAICQGNQTCVERSMQTNQALDRIEDRMNADDEN